MFLHIVVAQIQPSSEFILGDTTSHLQINDFFTDGSGTMYFTGQYVDDSLGLYISAVDAQLQKKFELIRAYGFDEEGYFIHPYDSTHFIVCGHSEDKTGTFNVRLLKLTRSGAVVWDTTFGNNGQFTMEIPHDLEIDSQGNIIVGGSSHAFELNYLLLKYSSEGNRLWSIQTRPQEKYQSTMVDIILDREDNIYGIINNTFINDSSHATVFKRNGAGDLLWQKHFNLSLIDNRPCYLELINDTLFVAAPVFTSGESPSSLAVISLTGNGNIAAYKQFPAPSMTTQNGMRSIQRVCNNKLAVLYELHSGGNYKLQTMILSNDLSVQFSDTVSGPSPFNVEISAVNESSFDVLRYGSGISTIRYSMNGSSVTASAPILYASAQRPFVAAEFHPPTISLVSVVQHPLKDQAAVTVYQQPVSDIHQHTETELLPKNFKLYPAFPNPFNPATIISYQVPANNHVTIKVFDIIGREVATLVNEVKEAGTLYRVPFNGGGLATGMYLVRLEYGGRSATQKIVLMK